jgi:hypothetical protein
MERCTCRCRNSQPLKIDLGPLPVDERAAYVELVCNTLDDSRNDRFWWNTVFLHAGRSGWLTGYWAGESEASQHPDIEFLQAGPPYQPPLSVRSGMRRDRGPVQNEHRTTSEVAIIGVLATLQRALHKHLARGPTDCALIRRLDQWLRLFALRRWLRLADASAPRPKRGLPRTPIHWLKAQKRVTIAFQE